MDYKEEYKKLNGFEPKEFFKPEAGTHRIMILSEPVQSTYEEHSEPKEQITLKIQVKNSVIEWSITKGVSFKSLYGQLIALAHGKGKLKEEYITLLVSGEGKAKVYIILEALPYVKGGDLNLLDV